MASKKALGKGLGALIGESRTTLSRGGEGRLRELSIGDIGANPRQPRRTFVDEELAELAASIKALGVVQPVVVRPLSAASSGIEQGGSVVREGSEAAANTFRYELIAGERRLRAAKLAGLEHIPALIRPADDVGSLEIAVAENVAREDLNGIEEAHAYAALIDEFGLTHEKVAQLVGRSRAAVSNTVRLLELPDDVQRMVERGELSEGHARALLALPDYGQRRTAARLVLTQGLSVRQTEELVKKLASPAPTASREGASSDPYITALVDELYGVLEAPVSIRSGRRGGTIQIAFKTKAEMNRLVALLRSLGA